MKRILAIIFSAVILFTFSACGSKKTDEDKFTVDLEYYADLGQIPECQYKLGSDPETVKAELSAAAEENEENLYFLDEGEENILIDNGIYNFYYKKDDAEDGISYIASFEKAFGFEIGTVSIEIKDAIDAEYEEEEATDDNAFFVWGLQSGSVLRYEFDDVTVLFVFEDNALCATAIFNSNWE